MSKRSTRDDTLEEGGFTFDGDENHKQSNLSPRRAGSWVILAVLAVR
jgi:hypothetical protein